MNRRDGWRWGLPESILLLICGLIVLGALVASILLTR